MQAGASLESLAKGAVQFSRRFTIKEIQDRWYSLLYDPVISEEASACMNNVELSALPLPSKLSKFGHSKERKVAPVKRKAESVRSSYYAMRKRILNDTINSMNLSFPMEPENNNNEGGEVELFPEGAALNHFGFEGSNFDHLHCPFPESLMDGNLGANEVPTHAFYTGAENPVEEDFSIEQKNILEGETQMLGDHMPFNGGVEEFPCPKEVPIDSLMGDDSLSTLPLSTFHQINSDPGNLCSGFDGSHVFNSPDLGCETSFNTLQLPPIPELSIWREDEGIQEADVPYDAVKDSTDSGEAYLAELSNSLLNFTNEEELYLMDVDGKDDFDKTYYDGLSSLLLNSSNDVCPDEMPTITQTDTPVASDSQVKDPPVPCHVEVDNIVLRSSDVEVVPQSEIKLPSYASARDPRYPELINGVICCVLNTEDPEIPSNEDVFLPFDAPPSIVPSSIKWTAREGNTPISSSGDGFGHQHRTAGGGTIMKQVELNTPGESHLSSQLVGSPPFPGPVGGSKVKRDLPNSHAPWTTSRSAGMDSSGPREIHSANTGVDAVVHSNSKEGAANIGLAKNLGINLSDPSNEKASHLSNSFRVLPHSNASSIKNEQDMAKPIKDKKLPHEEAGTSVVESKMVADPPTSDREEQYIESDDDVPYYSDVEAMVRRVIPSFHSTTSLNFCVFVIKYF